jgi:catechol 2,3-dioxygenase-like lactoylglutathione lyase family enzyme
MSAPRITHHILEVSDPERSLAFYRDMLGMTLIGEHSEADGARHYHLCFEAGDGTANDLPLPRPPATMLELRHRPSAAAAYAHSRDDLYWKIGITLADVDAARGQLTARGAEVSESRQFRDIGYLCHLFDPDGFQIELLQHTFETTPRPSATATEAPLGGPPTFAHTTLRVADLDAALGFWRDGLGMRLISRQAVEPYGFTLYFLGYTDAVMPVDDLDAVANREWLWQRPYSFIELQHMHAAAEAGQSFRTHDDDDLGFRGLRIAIADPAQTLQQLTAAGFAANTRSATVHSPDGTIVKLFSEANA